MEDVNENTSDGDLPMVDDPPAVPYQPTPENPPWNTIVAIIMWVASVVAIIVIPMLFILPYIVSHGPPFSETVAFAEFLQKDPTSIFLQIVAIIPAHILTLALAWAVVTRLNKFSFRETLGWESGGMKWFHYVGIIIAFFIVAMVIGNFYPDQENEFTRILKSSRQIVFLVAFMATFTAPVVEEVIYRGILYSAFQRTFGVAAAITAVTLLFALVHVPQYLPSYPTIFLLLLLSLTLTLVRARTRNLLPCIVLHTIFNATQSLLLILEPFMKSEAPIIEPTTGIHLK